MIHRLCNLLLIIIWSLIISNCSWSYSIFPQNQFEDLDDKLMWIDLIVNGHLILNSILEYEELVDFGFDALDEEQMKNFIFLRWSKMKFNILLWSKIDIENIIVVFLGNWIWKVKLKCSNHRSKCFEVKIKFNESWVEVDAFYFYWFDRIKETSWRLTFEGKIVDFEDCDFDGWCLFWKEYRCFGIV